MLKDRARKLRLLGYRLKSIFERSETDGLTPETLKRFFETYETLQEFTKSERP